MTDKKSNINEESMQEEEDLFISPKSRNNNNFKKLYFDNKNSGYQKISFSHKKSQSNKNYSRDISIESEEKKNTFLKKHRRSTSYNTEVDEPKFRKRSHNDFGNPNHLREDGEILDDRDFNNLPIVKKRTELRDIFNSAGMKNFSDNSDSLSKSSFEEIMESRKNKKDSFKKNQFNYNEEKEILNDFENLDNFDKKEEFFDFKNNNFSNDFNKNKYQMLQGSSVFNNSPTSIKFNYSNNRNNKVSNILDEDDKSNKNDDINQKLKSACIQIFETKQYTVEDIEEREESQEKILEIEKKITELREEQKNINENILENNTENTNQNINQNDIQINPINVKVEENINSNEILSNISLANSNHSFSLENTNKSISYKIRNLEEGELEEEFTEIIDINAMYVDDDNYFNFEENKSITKSNISNNISLDVNITMNQPSIKIEEQIPPKFKRKINPFSINLYDPYYESKIDPNDEEINSRIKEIEVMMNQIELNQEEKSLMRISDEGRIPKVKNKKEIYFNNSFLIFYLNTFPLTTLSRKLKKPNFKINLILDLDSTLLFAEQEKNIKENLRGNSHLIKPVINEIQYNLRVRLRKFTIEFIQRISKFSEIFIYTHGQEPYAKEVLKILYQESGIEIPYENLAAAKGQQTPKNLKYFNEDKMFKVNSLIVDDNMKAWDMEFWNNTIQSMKYLSFNPNKNFIDKNSYKSNFNDPAQKYSYTYLLSHNRFQDINEILQDFKDEYDAPFSLEYDFSKKFQMQHLGDLVENVYKLCVLQNISAEEALLNLKQNVLIGLCINVEFLDMELENKQIVKEMIKILGGKYESNNKNFTHYIISNTKLNEFYSHKANNNNSFKNRKFYSVNLKWIFHSFFFFKKVDENDTEYKLMI